MTRLQVKNKMRAEFGLGAQHDPLLNEYCNDAARYLCVELNHSWKRGTLNLVAGTQSYTLASDMLLLKVMVHSTTPVHIVEREALIDTLPTELEDEFYGYIAYGQGVDNVLYLYPTPTVSETAGITYDYYAQPLTPSDDNSGIITGGFEFDELFLAKMREMTARYIKHDMNLAGAFKQEFEFELERARGRVGQRHGVRAVVWPVWP